ncbi:MAG: TolC family protein, partial [Longimicrobiales bacterium]|nr:TolC family protein [Longimicrobiales bacterium]
MNTMISWMGAVSGVALGGTLALVPAVLSGQVEGGREERPISLTEAVACATEQSPQVAAARARARAARHGRRAARSFQWPTLGLEAGVVRSDDPVAAFGGRLRQARFTQADFDPARLNHPDPLTDWSGAVHVSWAPLDFASFADHAAAALDADAAGLGADWAARTAGFVAEARYVEAVAAERRLRAAQVAQEAAEANLRVTVRRREEGALTDADVLQARASLSGAEARRIDAERAVADARDRLAVALGWPDGVVPLPTDTTFTPPAGAAPVGVEARADLRASALRVRAHGARERQAARARLPTIQGFARIETHSAGVVEDIRDDWTVGFQIRVPLFTGFRIEAQREAASAMRDAAT